MLFKQDNRYLSLNAFPSLDRTKSSQFGARRKMQLLTRLPILVTVLALGTAQTALGSPTTSSGRGSLQAIVEDSPGPQSLIKRTGFVDGGDGFLRLHPDDAYLLREHTQAMQAHTQALQEHTAALNNAGLEQNPTAEGTTDASDIVARVLLGGAAEGTETLSGLPGFEA